MSGGREKFPSSHYKKVMKRKLCSKCGLHLAEKHSSRNGKVYYRSICAKCRNPIKWRHSRGKRPRSKFLKSNCEQCGFVPVSLCQLDLDHVDGNHRNNNAENLQTLCANCHRLKTFINRDWKKT